MKDRMGRQVHRAEQEEIRRMNEENAEAARRRREQTGGRKR
jgi:hypothetical protein